MPNQKTEKETQSPQSPQKIYSIEPTKIFVETERQRQLFNPKAMTELINSIKDLGQIEPIVCHKRPEDSRIELIAGERRLLACETIGIEVQFILHEEIKEALILERLQLEENLVREDLEWKEEVLAKKRIFDILTSTTKRKTVQAVADYLGVSKAALSEDITLAIWIPENDEVAAAPNKSTAKKIIKRLSLMITRDNALTKSLQEAQTISLEESSGEENSTTKAPIEEDLEDFGSDFDLDLAFDSPDSSKSSPQVNLAEAQILYYDKNCLLGSMEKELLNFPDNHFDIVLFDPPWGVDYDKSQKDAPSQQRFEDSSADFHEIFSKQLHLLYQKMSEDSHIYVFFGITQYKFIHWALTLEGFKTSGFPLFWHKAGACRTRTPEWDYGRSYEPIAFARKGSKKLNFPPMANIITTPQPSQTLKDIHPSAKHPEIYLKLLTQSGFPGDKILDPTAGSGMMAVAAEELRSQFNFEWTQIEVNPDYRNLQLFNLTKGYEEITSPSLAISPPPDDSPLPDNSTSLPSDFRSIIIGSADWLEFWKTHPEKQREMLEWAENSPPSGENL